MKVTEYPLKQYSSRSAMLVGAFILFFWHISFISDAQMLRDTSVTRKVNRCVGYIYNFRFSEADDLCNQLETAFPKSPAVPLIRGMIIYWKNYPLLPSSKERASYEKALKLSIALSERRKPSGDEAEYLLADMCARGLLLLFYSDNDMSGEVIPLATSTWRFLKESFNYTNVYPDFCFFTGLYHYYREKYPEIHPIYKPLAALFPPGNSEQGLKELQTAFSKSIVLNAEAGGFLSWIYSGYEFNINSSLIYSRLLFEKYPDNAYYVASYIKYLLLGKQYDDAENLVDDADEKINNTYLKAQIMVFRGIIQEKKYNSFKQAALYYTNGLKALSSYGDYANEFSAYSYFGLSRVADPGKKGDARKKYRKEAIRLAEFGHLTFDE